MIMMMIASESQPGRVFIRPKRFPLGTLLEGVAVLLALLSLTGRWALAPEGNLYALDHWQGWVVLIPALVGLPLVGLRLLSLPIVRSLWYFLPMALIAVALLVGGFSFVVTHDVVSMNETAPPEELDPTTVRGDDIGLAVVGGVILAIVTVVHLGIASTMTNHGGSRVPLARAGGQSGGVLEPELAQGESGIALWPVNLYGWITRGPRMAVVAVTSRRLVFMPPPLGRREGFRRWLHSFVYKYDWSQRPPLAEVVELRFEDILKVDSSEGRAGSQFTRLSVKGDAWGFRIVRDLAHGEEISWEDHEADARIVESAWQGARAGDAAA